MYRVHPLPESMRPLVWDFGRLTDHTEELYTAQIVRRFMVSPTPDVSIKTTCCLKLDIQDKHFTPFSYTSKETNGVNDLNTQMV